MMSSGETNAFINDMKKVTTTLVFCSITGFVLSCSILYFLSMFAETIAWFCIVFLQIGLTTASLYGFYKRTVVLGLIKSMDLGTNAHINKYSMESMASILLWIGILFAVLAFVYLVLMVGNFKHVKTAIQVIDAAAEFMVGNKRVVAVPFVYFFLTIGIFLGWVQCMIGIIGLNKITSDATAAQP